MSINDVTTRINGFDNWTINNGHTDPAKQNEEPEEFSMFDINLSSYSSDLREFAQEYIKKYDTNGDGKWSRDEFMKMSANMQDDELASYKAISDAYEEIKTTYTNHISQFDTDGDGALNQTEFEAAFGDHFAEQTLDLDGDPDHVSADELTVSAEYASGFTNIELAFSINDFLKNVNKAFDALNLDDDTESISAEEFATMLYAADMDWGAYAQTLDVASSIDGKLDYDNYIGVTSLVEGDAGYDILRSEREDFFNAFYAE